MHASLLSSFAFLSFLSFTSLASPVPATTSLRKLQCSCLSFSPASSVTIPRPCLDTSSQSLTYDSALAYASTHGLRIYFASWRSASLVQEDGAGQLPVQVSPNRDGEPVVLDSGANAHASRSTQVAAWQSQTIDKVVCGMGDEVQQQLLSEGADFSRERLLGMEGNTHRVGGILAVLSLCVVGYALVDAMLMRDSAQEDEEKEGEIVLEGNEKKLMG